MPVAAKPRKCREDAGIVDRTRSRCGGSPERHSWSGTPDGAEQGSRVVITGEVPDPSKRPSGPNSRLLVVAEGPTQYNRQKRYHHDRPDRDASERDPVWPVLEDY